MKVFELFDEQKYDRIAASLEYLNDWYNVTATKKISPETFIKKIKPIIDEFGYTPFTGNRFRVFKTNSTATEGDEVTIETGRGSIQSWAMSRKAAENFRSYLGNEKNVVLVELLSDGHEVMNVKYIRDVVNKLKPIKNQRLKNAIKEFNTIFTGPDENESTMIMPEKSKVRILKMWPKYNG